MNRHGQHIAQLKNAHPYSYRFMLRGQGSDKHAILLAQAWWARKDGYLSMARIYLAQARMLRLTGCRRLP